MAIKIYNPTSPGRRDASTLANEEITKRDPEKSLVFYKKKRAGRNNEGKVTQLCNPSCAPTTDKIENREVSSLT